MNKLDFGATFQRVFDLYGKYFTSLITYSAIFYGAIALIWAVIAGVFVSSVAAGAALGLAGIVITIIASVLITGAYIVGLDEAERTGAFPSLGEVWPKVTPKLGALIITGLLYALGVAVGFIFLIIPGLVLATWWFVSSPVVMLEGKSGMAALGRSRELVRGNGWTVFGLFIVVTIIASVAGGILGGIAGAIFSFNDIAESFARQFVPGVFTAPISALLAVIVYQSLVGGGNGGDVPDVPAPPTSQQPPTTPQPPASPKPPSDPNAGGQSGPFV